jgi:geranylgeranyl reductase family protein
VKVAIVGAGPGGATAALALARAGATVELIEKSAWPRAKTCGDGISPLAIAALHALGVDVTPNLELRAALVATPRGTYFRGGWPAATPWGTIVERRVFDASLVDAAIVAGANFRPATTVRTIHMSDRDVAVTCVTNQTESVMHADAVIVADGASGVLAKQLGFPAHRSRVVAIRAYADARNDLRAEYGLFYDRLLSPGYGWIFPIGRRRANVGICVDDATLVRAGGNARVLLGRWLSENPVARATFGAQAVLEDERGGVIPSGRRRRSNGRVLLVGDAAGVADPFTAEGIYEAISSARHAADALIAVPDVAAAGHSYERSLTALDRNERSARLLRATFNVAIEPYARYAAGHTAFADRLMTDVFFAKPGWAQLLWHLHFGDHLGLGAKAMQ